MLVTLFLIMKLRYSQSRCEEPGSRRSTSDVGFLAPNEQTDIPTLPAFNRNWLLFYLFICFSKLQQSTGLDTLKRTILKRYSDLDYDSFVGLMGRRNAGESSFEWRTLSAEYMNEFVVIMMIILQALMLMIINWRNKQWSYTAWC